MPDPLDPLAFLQIAQELAREKDEAKIRTAVGRGYYALFLLAREKTGVTSTRAVHTEVVRAVRRRSGYRATADQLDALRRLRVVADHQLLPDDVALRDWSNNWASVQALIEHILPKLQAW
jgi:hypothetical protein